MQPFSEGGVGLPGANLMAFYVFRNPLPIPGFLIRERE